MKLGFLTAPFEDLGLMEIADWAATSGFSALEIACWPPIGGKKRRYAGTSHIDVGDLDNVQAKEICDELREKGIVISGLGYYPNPLDSDSDHRFAVIEHLKSVVSAASLLDVKVVNTFVGGDRNLTVDENWARAQIIFPDILAHARDHGVTLAFENCPMLFSNDEWPGGHNIAYAPRIWRRIFDTWDGVGMNFDPSHLVLQMIDQGRFIREFGAKFAHVHAKDLMIDRDGLYERGIFSLGMGWQVPKLCGLGNVDWADFFKQLNDVGYDGSVIIEHEDRDYEGSDEKIKRGFGLARDILSPFMH
ncbi:MAG: sugar phosphate isomerase/epimerase [Rhodobacteraceae bacterium]|nr:sugar phosphate isomerase/epimerase [Paracoccaceae bacterium]